MSDPILISEKYMFIIDTNYYVDYFGSELCAYCTGFDDEDVDIGYSNMFYMEMGLDDEEDNLAIDKNPFKEVISEDEDRGFLPWNYWLSRNWGIDDQGNYGRINSENYGNYNYPAPFSLAIFFNAEPTLDQINIIKERSVKFFSEIWPKSEENEDKKNVEIEGFRLIKHTKYGEEKSI